MGYSLPSSSISGFFPGKNAGMDWHFLHPEDLPDPGIEPGSPALQADSLSLSHQGSTDRWWVGM